MKTLYKVVLLVLLCFSFFSCSHTNELARYNLSGEKIFFKHSVKNTLSTANVDIEDPLNKNTGFPITIILTETGSGIARDKVQEKINNAFRPDSVAASISNGMREGLLTYYTVNPVESLSDNPRFVIESRLERFTLSSGSYGVNAYASAEVIVIDRRSGATVWRNSETSVLPLKENTSYYTADKTVRSIGSVVNAVRLMQMSEDEIREAIKFTSEAVGEELMDELREDIAESRYK